MASRKLKIGLMGLAAKTIPAGVGNICAPHEIVNNLAKQLSKIGHEVIVFTGADSKNDLKVESAGLNSAWKEFGPEVENAVIYTQRRCEYDLILSTEAIKRYKTGELDIINSHDFRLNPYLFSQVNIPVLYTVHGEIANYRTSYDLYRYNIMAKSNMGLTSISRENERLSSELKVESYGYTPNGIDIDKYAFNNEKREGLLFVGRMIPEKGIKEIIKVAEIAGETLTLIGPAGVKEKEIAYFDDLKKNFFTRKGVAYLGFKSQTEIIPYYHQAKALIFLSQSEGMPMVILEAMSCGLPVIASKTGGISDIISDGIDGFLIDSISVEKIVAKIKEIDKISNKTCRKKIVNNFSLESMARNYLNAYQDFLKK